jgi:hypothetical protein
MFRPAQSPKRDRRLEIFCIRTGYDNFSCEVAAENMGKFHFRRHGATADVKINGIHIHGGDFDEILICGRLRFWQIAVNDFFRAAGFVDVSRFHRSSFVSGNGMSSYRPRAAIAFQRQLHKRLWTNAVQAGKFSHLSRLSNLLREPDLPPKTLAQKMGSGLYIKGSKNLVIFT